MDPRTRLFFLIAAACMAAGAVIVVLAVRGADRTPAVLARDAPRPPEGLDRRTHVLVRAVDTSGDPLGNGRLSEVTPTGVVRVVGGAPACMRIAFSDDRGACLYAAGLGYRMALLDSELRVTRTMGLTGIPSRVRLSPRGRWAGVTTFVSGHSYAEAGAFSTRAQIVDVRRGRTIGDLERWRFTHDGREVDARDRNFWGLTFDRDEDRFYATMATGPHHYLVRGSIRDRRGEVLRDGVECPALSPDGRRIAYKKPLGGGRWRFHVLHLASGTEVPLAERRSVDDQAAWLDDEHVAYSDGRVVWVARADGTGQPQELVRDAASPAVRAPAS